MGFGDKFKELKTKAQESVAEHKDQIHDAVDAVGVAANAKTHGKHAGRIAKFGEKASGMVDKFGGSGEEEASPEASAPAEAQETPAATHEPAAAAPADKAPTFGDPPKFDE